MDIGATITKVMLFVCFLLGHDLFSQEKGASLYDGPVEKLYVYLLIGQSNMAGRAPVSEEDLGVIENGYLLNDEDQWEPAANPFNRYSTIRKELGMQKMNPGYSFAKAMLQNKNGISVGLVVNARGGTKIEQWAQGSTYYAEAIRRAQIAKRSGVLKGVLWHQGEGNANSPAGYLEKLEDIIQGLRRDLNQPDLPFVAGQIYNTPVINEQMACLPESVPMTGFVSSRGLSVMDQWHFDAGSMKLLGQRYADEMLKLENL